MTQPLVIWPPIPLPIRATQNNEPASSQIIARLSGNAAGLVGYINGTTTISDAPNTLPRSPSGQLGHDHSGGEWGQPMYRSVACMYFNRTANASVDAGPEQYISTQPFSDVIYQDRTYRIWVPPCDKTYGAYRKMHVRVHAKYESDLGDGMQAGDSVDLVLERGNFRATQAVVDASADETVWYEFDDVPFKPARWCSFRITCDVEYDGAATNRYPRFQVFAVEIGVRAP